MSGASKTDLTWHDVFACHKWWGHIDKFADGARAAGYSHFSWNGWVYAFKDGGYERLDLLADDLED